MLATSCSTETAPSSPSRPASCHVELRPESRTTAHEVMKLDLAMHILQIEGIVVGALIRGLDDSEAMTQRKSDHQ